MMSVINFFELIFYGFVEEVQEERFELSKAYATGF